MTSEEIHLNDALKQAGYEVVESDLGEYIVQLRGEAPYHLVFPAMQLTRHEISDLFHEKLHGLEASLLRVVTVRRLHRGLPSEDRFASPPPPQPPQRGRKAAGKTSMASGWNGESDTSSRSIPWRHSGRAATNLRWPTKGSRGELSSV